jgi:hypothetical protein
MNLQEVFKKIEMALTPSEDATPEVQEVQEEVKVEMATMKLAGGVVVEAESFEAGENVFLLGEDDEKVAAPVGEHELEDGRILVIVEEGVISEIREAGETEEVVEEVVEEESTEMAEEEEMAYVSKEEFTAAIDEIKEMIAAMMPQEEEMASEEVKEEEQVEMSADEAPAAKKVAAAPVEKKQDMVQFSKKAGSTTLSRIMSKLS